MSSPFPGMDPFIEGQLWRDFHASFPPVMREFLNRELPPGYVTRVESDVVLCDDGGWSQPRVADLSVSDDGSAGGAGVAVAEPETGVFLTTFPEPDELRFHRVEVLDAETLSVVTILELLSPENKRGGWRSGDHHATKRREVLSSDQTSLVELDLLRGGRRPPTTRPLPECDYAAFVYEAWSRPNVRAYPWSLLDPMPTVAVPLREDDGSVPLDLQAAFETTFERNSYGRLLRYDGPCVPPLPESAAAFVRGD